MLRTRLARTFLVGLGILSWVAANTGHAATRTWTGGGGNGNWTNAANWGGVAPVAGDDVVFAGGTNLSTNNNFAAGTEFRSITFDATAGAFTLAGNGITIGGRSAGTLASQQNFQGATIDSIINDSSSMQTVNLGVSLAAGRHLFEGGDGGLKLNPAGGLNRAGGAVAVFTPGAGGISTSTITNTNGILGGWATVGTDWAAVSGGNIAAYTGYTDVAGGGTITSSAASNVRINVAGAPVTMAAVGTTDINTLLYSVDGVAQNVDIGAGNTLRLGAQGGVYRTATSNNGIVVGTAGLGETLTAGGADNTPGEIVLNANQTADTNNTVFINANITDNGTGAVRVVKTGFASAQLNGTNTFTGGLFIVQGRQQLGSPNSVLNSDITVLPGGHAFLGSGDYTNDWFIAGTGTGENNGNGAIRASGGTILSGTINLIGNARIVKRTGTGGISTISGQITGPYEMQFGGNNNDNGDFPIIVISNSTNNWTGNTLISESSRLRLGASEVIPHGPGVGNLVMTNTRNDTDNWTILDLNGFNETVNGLVANTTIAVTDQVSIENNDPLGSLATLTIGANNASSSYNGQIRDFNPDTANGGVAAGGTVGITKIGTSTLTLNGTTLSHSGPTTVNGGRLNLDSALPNSALTINNGAALGTSIGTTLNSTLTFGAAATDTSTLHIVPTAAPGASFSLTGTDTLVVNSGANTITVNVNGVVSSGTTYRVIDYNGTIQGTGAGAGAFQLGTLPNRTVANLVNNTTDQAIDLNVTSVDRPRWTGALSSEWSTAVLANPGNWVLDSNGTTKTDYLENDNVLFTDSATNTTVNVGPNDVTPAGVEFNNSTKNYTLGGSKGIVGSTGLIKSGTGELTITNPNSYTGTTTIAAGSTVRIGNGGTSGSLGTGPVVNDGTLIINRSDAHTVAGAIDGTGEVRHIGTGVATLSGAGTHTGVTNIQSGTVKTTNSGSLGAPGSGTVNISNGATLDVGGSNVVNNTSFGAKQINVVGTGIGGLGAIINSNTTVGQQNALQLVTLTGNTTFGAYGRFDLRDPAPADVPPVLDLAGFTLTKKGTAHFGIVAGTITDGNIIMEEGIFAIEGASTVSDALTGNKITFQDNTELRLFGTQGAGTITRPMEFNGSVGVHNNDDAASTFDSPITLKGAATFTWINDADPVSPTTLNGVISEMGGPRGIEAKTLNAANSLVLTGENTFTGSVSISGPGRLDISPAITGLPYLGNTANVSVGSNSILGLNYTGTDTIGALLIGGVSLAPGVYGPIGSGFIERAELQGTGSLTVTDQILPGDFNNDNQVNAADYVVWRNNEGTFNTLANDPLFGTEIDADQYNIWRANFGNALPGSGGGAALPGAVPEPGAVVLVLVAMIGALFLRSRGVRGV